MLDVKFDPVDGARLCFFLISNHFFPSLLSTNMFFICVWHAMRHQRKSRLLAKHMFCYMFHVMLLQNSHVLCSVAMRSECEWRMYNVTQYLPFQTIWWAIIFMWMQSNIYDDVNSRWFMKLFLVNYVPQSIASMAFRWRKQKYSSKTKNIKSINHFN